MNEALERLKREKGSGKSLTGTVVSIYRHNDDPDRMIIDYTGCLVIVPASTDATRDQLDRLLGMDMAFFVTGVAPDDGIAVGYCQIPPGGVCFSKMKQISTNRHPLFTRKFRNGKLAHRR